MKYAQPTEEQEQRTLAQWLDAIGVLWCHVPNGGARNAITGRKLKEQGTKPGVPDCLIFERPPLAPLQVGVAIELKRREGGRLSPEQSRWLASLAERRWVGIVAHGAPEAIRLLKELGFGSGGRA